MSKKVAFVSYNEIYGAQSNGWTRRDERSALVLAKRNQASLFDSFASIINLSSLETAPAQLANEREQCQADAASAQTELRSVLDELDHVVLYMGLIAADSCLRLAQDIPVGKVTFVMCDCSLLAKLSRLSSAGFDSSGWVESECSGQTTMGEILSSFLKTGSLPAATTIKSSLDALRKA